MQSVGNKPDTTIQFIINATKQTSALKLIRREAEARQHDHENQAMPDLQPPLDGFEYFHSMQ